MAGIKIDRAWLMRLVELTVALLLWQFNGEIVTWAARTLHLPLPEMPLLKHAYMLFALVVLVAVWVVARGEKLSDFGLVIPKRAHILILRALLLLAILVAFDVVVRPMLDPFIAKLTGTSATLAEQHFASVKGNLGLFLYLLPFALVFGGLGEEFMFRGFAMTRIAQLLGGSRAAWIAAVFLQAVPFALGHGYQGPVGIVAVYLAALVTGFGTIAWGRNLWPAIIEHGLQDSLGFFLLYIGVAHA